MAHLSTIHRKEDAMSNETMSNESMSNDRRTEIPKQNARWLSLDSWAVLLALAAAALVKLHILNTVKW
jgi:hypothetical protein